MTSEIVRKIFISEKAREEFWFSSNIVWNRMRSGYPARSLLLISPEPSNHASFDRRNSNDRIHLFCFLLCLRLVFYYWFVRKCLFCWSRSFGVPCFDLLSLSVHREFLRKISASSQFFVSWFKPVRHEFNLSIDCRWFLTCILSLYLIL